MKPATRGRPNSFVTRCHLVIIAQRQWQKALVTFRKLASSFNPFMRIGFLPRDGRNSLQKVHSVMSFPRKITKLDQQVDFQMALPDKTVGFTPTWPVRNTPDSLYGQNWANQRSSIFW